VRYLFWNLDDELYYDQEYTVKELLKICKYYGIDKELKASKCKKQDIVSTIIYFEGQPENYEIVEKRHKMWAFITELLEDTKMKNYLIW
jgi:Zn-dependent peptidase ImmA (M78 family)